MGPWRTCSHTGCTASAVRAPGLCQPHHDQLVALADRLDLMDREDVA